MSRLREPQKGEKLVPAVVVGVESMSSQDYRNYIKDCVQRYEHNEPQAKKSECIAHIYLTLESRGSFGITKAGKSYMPTKSQSALRDWAIESDGIMKDALVDFMFYLKIDDIHEAIRKRWSDEVFTIDPETGLSKAETMIAAIRGIFIKRLGNKSAQYLSAADLIDKSIISFEKMMRKKVKVKTEVLKPERSYTGSEKMKEFRWEKIKHLFGNFKIESRGELYKFIELGLQAFKQYQIERGNERNWEIFEKRVVNPPAKQTLEKIAAEHKLNGERIRQISVSMTREFVDFLVRNSRELLAQLENQLEEMV